METAFKETTSVQTAQQIENIFRKQHINKAKLKQCTAQDRIVKLRKLKEAILENRAQIKEAIYQDFRKPPEEVDTTEIYPVIKAIDFTIKNLNNWVKPKKVDTPLALMGTSSYVYYEPKGVTLIIAPWNYPFQLLIDPLVSAIAAGCTAVLKPSEVTPHTAAMISKFIVKLFKEDEVAVIEGDKDVSTELLAKPFDHIFFTGSPEVGKIVMKAAAANLTSVTLELGGKSPVIVDETADLKDAAEKITYGKFVNCGQTCIAPDYLLVDEKVKEPFIKELKTAIHKSFGEGSDQEKSASYARIVNNRHLERVANLINDANKQGAKIVEGGSVNYSQNFIAPTIIENVHEQMHVMQEEIFGPVLPVVTFKKLPEAISMINNKEKPLALYMFSKSSENIAHVTANTSAGGSCINETLVHVANPNLPFGGVNWSGIGKTHGHYGFLAFSNEKAVLKQRTGFTAVKMLYPPYNNRVRKMIDLLLRYF